MAGSLLNPSSVTALSNLLLVIPNVNQGITSELDNKSFLFHYEGENSVSLESDITDHLVEDNTSIQDQISLKPIKITTHGYIGELNDVGVPGIPSLAQATSKLSLLAPFQPALTVAAIEAYNQAAFLYSTAADAAATAVSVFSSLAGFPSVQNQQQQAYTFFEMYWQKRILFTVQTPWKVFKHMAIQSLRAVQDEDTRMISTFEITFKAMKFASDIISLPVSQERNAAQTSAQVDLGNSSGTQGPSLSPNSTGAIK